MNALYVYGYTNWLYLVILNALCIYWFYIGVLGFKAENDQLWAKRFFLFSVILITIVNYALVLPHKYPQHKIVFF